MTTEPLTVEQIFNYNERLNIIPFKESIDKPYHSVNATWRGVRNFKFSGVKDIKRIALNTNDNILWEITDNSEDEVSVPIFNGTNVLFISVLPFTSIVFRFDPKPENPIEITYEYVEPENFNDKLFCYARFPIKQYLPEIDTTFTYWGGAITKYNYGGNITLESVATHSDLDPNRVMLWVYHNHIVKLSDQVKDLCEKVYPLVHMTNPPAMDFIVRKEYLEAFKERCKTLYPNVRISERKVYIRDEQKTQELRARILSEAEKLFEAAKHNIQKPEEILVNPI